jgi:hypothetical protein
MRMAAEPAGAAVRSIALVSLRVVMALTSPSSSAVSIAEQGKTRVNRLINALLLAERNRMNQGRG